MERVSFIQHKGKKILYIDASNVNIEEALAVIAKARETIRSQPEKSVFILTNLTNARFDDKVTAAMKEYVAGNKPYVAKSAVVGVTGLKQILYNAIMKFSGRKVVMFNTQDQAKEWLVE